MLICKWCPVGIAVVLLILGSAATVSYYACVAAVRLDLAASRVGVVLHLSWVVTPFFIILWVAFVVWLLWKWMRS
jgi:hypothetical protein